MQDGQRTFARAELRGIWLSGESLSNCDFTDATINGLHIQSGALDSCKFDRAQISRFYCDGTGITKSSFDRALFSNVTLRNVDIAHCTLQTCSFRTSTLDAVNFADCDLSSASFENARFVGTRWVDTQLRELDVRGATFHDCDVGPLCDTAVQSVHGALFDWKTICKSLRAEGLMRILIASGFPEIMATYTIDAARTVDPLLLFTLMRSTFISYGGPDAPFARQLRERLHANGVRTFFFERDAIPGERIHEVMRREVNEHDRVILICSAASLNRSGVKNEIVETLAREARDGGASYLIPITIDDYLFSWNDTLGFVIRDRVVADFRRAVDEDIKFEQEFIKLLRALRTS
jgi:hypothetical protein